MAQQFAQALKIQGRRQDGYIESEDAVVTWCVGHLVTMSYPEAYDARFKRWSVQTLPFLPKDFKYEIIPGVAKQFSIVKGLLTRPDIDTIYVCTDSGREGEYIYRLVAQMAGVGPEKKQKRVWIDSQTEEEILRGIREAKDEAEYDNLSASAYLRAKEDYLMGINFSRALTLKFGPAMGAYLGESRRPVLSAGRVMTCVLGMAVRREREIREFVKTPFYRVIGTFLAERPKGKKSSSGQPEASGPEGTASLPETAGLERTVSLSEAPGLEAAVPVPIQAEWRAVEGSRYFNTPWLYKDNGFKEREKAQELMDFLMANEDGTRDPLPAKVVSKEKKKETKNPPLLFNLAELQNTCSKMFKISPDETLKIVQELYEKKLVTYPRTDARVLSSAVAKEIGKNLGGLKSYGPMAALAGEVLGMDSWKKIGKSRYVNDKQITDHYAIIPTGQGLGNIGRLSPLSEKVYQVICRRFLAIFYPAAAYQRYSLELERRGEHFFASFKVLVEPGWLKAAGDKKALNAGVEESLGEDKEEAENAAPGRGGGTGAEESGSALAGTAAALRPAVSRELLLSLLADLKKGDILSLTELAVKEGETSPPKRYTSGSMILAMENAGQLIEDEELRAQIKGSGIGTSATRAEILKKLFNIKYLSLNKKTQVITPTLFGEMVYDVVDHSIRQLLNPELTASWEKGLTYVAEGTITSEEYMEKLGRFVAGRTLGVIRMEHPPDMRGMFDAAAAFYEGKKKENDAK